MAESTLYFLECETKDKNLGMTSLSERLDALINDYADWLRRNEITHGDVAFAKIFRASDFGCIAVLDGEDGTVILQPRCVRGGWIGKQFRRALFHLRYTLRSLRFAFDFKKITVKEEPPEEEDEQDDYGEEE